MWIARRVYHKMERHVIWFGVKHGWRRRGKACGIWSMVDSSPTRTMLVWNLGLAKYSDMLYLPFDVFPFLKSLR